MLIINHGYFKSQVFYFVSFNISPVSILTLSCKAPQAAGQSNHINDSINSEMAFSMPSGFSNLIRLSTCST